MNSRTKQLECFNDFINQQGIKLHHRRPLHPQTQGKIERYHRSMKNVVKQEIYYSPDELRFALTRFVDYYNNERYHESLNNMTPAQKYFGQRSGANALLLCGYFT